MYVSLGCHRAAKAYTVLMRANQPETAVQCLVSLRAPFSICSFSQCKKLVVSTHMLGCRFMRKQANHHLILQASFTRYLHMYNDSLF